VNSYNIPNVAKNYQTSNSNQFLLLNNEFREDQFIFGFIFYGNSYSYINPVPYFITNYWNITNCNTTLMFNKTLTTTNYSTNYTTNNTTLMFNKTLTSTTSRTTTTNRNSSNTTQIPNTTQLNGKYYNLTLCNTYLNSTNISMINYTTNYINSEIITISVNINFLLFIYLLNIFI